MTLEEFDQRMREAYEGADYHEICNDLRADLVERDELRDMVSRGMARERRHNALNARAIAPCDHFRAALESYGRHDEGCARAGLEFKLREEDYPCTCGLAEALQGEPNAQLP